MLVATWCGAVDVVLGMAGRSVWTMYNAIAALAADLVLNIILIPRIGIVGAAIAWAVAILINNLAPLLELALWMGLHPFGRATTLAAILPRASASGALPLIARPLVHHSLPAELGVAVLRRPRSISRSCGGCENRCSSKRFAEHPAARSAQPSGHVLTGQTARTAAPRQLPYRRMAGAATVGDQGPVEPAQPGCATRRPCGSPAGRSVADRVAPHAVLDPELGPVRPDEVGLRIGHDQEVEHLHRLAPGVGHEVVVVDDEARHARAAHPLEHQRCPRSSAGPCAPGGRRRISSPPMSSRRTCFTQL